mmetsp:Transcript_6242/g.16662  ORF Transcript_6242/g.16662 Transcript_6242/m.16662 type:complete len:328 (-) Transcript_6242:644-1627(-)
MRPVELLGNQVQHVRDPQDRQGYSMPLERELHGPVVPEAVRDAHAEGEDEDRDDGVLELRDDPHEEHLEALRRRHDPSVQVIRDAIGVVRRAAGGKIDLLLDEVHGDADHGHGEEAQEHLVGPHGASDDHAPPRDVHADAHDREVPEHHADNVGPPQIVVFFELYGAEGHDGHRQAAADGRRGGAELGAPGDLCDGEVHFVVADVLLDEAADGLLVVLVPAQCVPRVALAGRRQRPPQHDGHPVLHRRVDLEDAPESAVQIALAVRNDDHPPVVDPARDRDEPVHEESGAEGNHAEGLAVVPRRAHLLAVDASPSETARRPRRPRDA